MDPIPPDESNPRGPLGHYDAVRLYHDHARETLRQFAHSHGFRIDGWHYTMTRTPVEVAGFDYLAVSGTVIARCNYIYFCLRFSLSLQPGRVVPLPVNFPTFKVRRLDPDRAAGLNFQPEDARMEITPVC